MLQVVEGRSARTRLQKDLVRILKAEMHPVGTRTIGFPSGHYPLRVVTLGEGRLWAAFSRNEDSPNMRFANSFGLYDDDRPSLDITVEINVAYEQTAMVAGMIAIDGDTGRGYLMHSGRVAGGYPGVGMKVFWRSPPGRNRA